MYALDLITDVNPTASTENIFFFTFILCAAQHIVRQVLRKLLPILGPIIVLAFNDKLVSLFSPSTYNYISSSRCSFQFGISFTWQYAFF